MKPVSVKRPRQRREYEGMGEDLTSSELFMHIMAPGRWPRSLREITNRSRCSERAVDERE